MIPDVSNSKFALFVNAMDALSTQVAILDLEGTIVAVNQHWRAHYKADDYQGQRCDVGDNYVAICQAALDTDNSGMAVINWGLQAVLSNQQDHFYLEYPSDTNRNHRWYLLRITCFTHEGSTYILVTQVDITPRKNAEMSLQASELALRQLHQITHHAQYSFAEKVNEMLRLGCEVLQLDLGIVSRIEGKSYEVMHVYDPSHAVQQGDIYALVDNMICDITLKATPTDWPISLPNLGVSAYDSHPARHHTGLNCYLGMPIMVGEVIYGTLNFSSPNARDTAFKPTDHALIKLMAQWLGMEIDRRQARAWIQWSETRFRTMFEASPDAIFIGDPDTGIITDCNHMAEILLGRRTESIIGMHQTELHPRHLRQEVGEIFNRYVQQLRQGLELPEVELVVEHANGTEITVSVLAQLLEINHQSMVIGIFRNVTEQRQTQAELARMYQAEQALRQAALALASTTDLDQVIDRILLELENVIAYDSASVQVMVGHNQFELINGRGFANPDAIKGLLYSADGNTPNRQVVQSRHWVIIDDVQAEYSTFFQQALNLAEHTRSWLGVPMLYQDRIIGMLTLDKQQAGFYTKTHAEIASVFATHAAVALENARLHQQSQQEIQERKQVEIALRNSEARYRAIVEDQTELINRHLPDGTLTFINQAYCRFFNKSEAELIGSSLFLLIPEIDRQYVADRMASATPENPVMYSEHRIFLPDGSIGWQHWTDRGIFSQDGRLLEFQSVGRDVTERKIAEDALRESEAHFRLLTENASDLICLHHPTGEYIYLSPSCERLLGYSPAELIGVNPYTLFHPNDQDMIRNTSHQPMLQGEDASRITYRIQRKTGDYIWFETHTHPIVDDNGNVIQLITGSRDITERIQTQVNIANRLEVEQLTSQVSSILHNAIGSTQMQDGLREVMQMLSSFTGADRVYAMLLTDSLVTAVYEWIYPDIPSMQHMLGETLPTMPWFMDQIQAGQVVPVRNVANLPDATGQTQKFWQAMGVQSFMALPLRYEEQTLGIISIEAIMYDMDWPKMDGRTLQTIADITASTIVRQEAIEALTQERGMLAARVEAHTAELRRANAELARTARLKDEFLASMSHELRTPLNAILTLSEVLQEDVYGPLTERQRKSLETIEESGRHLLVLINDILDLSKIEAQQMELTFGSVGLDGVSQASLRMVKELAKRKNIKLFNTATNAPASIRADERRLKQILVNLLNNAVKFTPDGGQVGLEITGDEAHKVIHFTVWDTGIGIAPEDQQRLFQPFVQIDSRLSRKYSGTGLGLSLVARLTEMHQGSISLTSAEGQGSRFTITLPWQKPDVPTIAPRTDTLLTPEHVTPVVENSNNQYTVLMAEDNEANILSYGDYLRLRGYHLVIARNGREAVELARDIKPDLILMDIQMPEMDGLEAIQRIRTEPDLVHTPIIALTALAMAGDRERCLAAGANAYLSKPISLKRLINEIEKQLEARLS